MESAFPQFGDGDVNITIYEDMYRLHSTVLKARSRELRNLLLSLGSYGIGHFGCVQLELVESASHGYGVLEVLVSCRGGGSGLVVLLALSNTRTRMTSIVLARCICSFRGPS